MAADTHVRWNILTQKKEVWPHEDIVDNFNVYIMDLLP